jgi:hypothetical protein
MLVVLGLVLTACGGGAGSVAGKSNAELLKAAVANMKAAKSYHMSADIQQGEESVQFEGDIDIANKRMKLDMTAGGHSISMIQIDDKAYLSLDGGVYYPEPPSGEASDFDSLVKMWEDISPEDIDKAKDALKDGTPATEQIDGVQTKHITGNAKDLQALSGEFVEVTDGTIDFWVTTDANPTIRQMSFQGKSDDKDMKALFKWSKINEDMQIEPPANSSSMGTAYTLPSNR